MNALIVQCPARVGKNKIPRARQHQRDRRRPIVAGLHPHARPATASRYQVRGMPTLLFMRNGQLVKQLVGAVPERQLLQKIKALLN